MISAIKMSDYKGNSREITTNIPVENIRPNPYQPRKFFDISSLNELAGSISEFGIIQPLCIRSLKSGGYELIAGERRLRAAKIAGLSEVPCIISDISESESAFVSLVENIQRQSLNFIEEAESYESIINDYGFTQEALAKKLNKSQSSVANKLRLLKLNPEIKKLLISGELTERHGRAVLRLPDEALREKIIKKAIEEGLNVKKTEELVEKEIKKICREDATVIHKRTEKRSLKDIKLFINTLDKSVDILKQAGMSAEYIVEEKEDGCDIMLSIGY
ncbi:MAG: ParB/RepB/Spo0J family partition protein [Lachnospiraceae bacterium]|nr:ParB/RepB/Spo0J family partition protein [Lachnospiraceae bacterium]